MRQTFVHWDVLMADPWFCFGHVLCFQISDKSCLIYLQGTINKLLVRMALVTNRNIRILVSWSCAASLFCVFFVSKREPYTKESSPRQVQNVTKMKSRIENTSKEDDTHNVTLVDFGLYLRMYHKKRHLYETLLVPSMKQFWLLPVNLTVVLDDTPEDRAFGQKISQKYPYPIICHMPKFDAKIYGGDGYNLQQLSMFYVEVCFNHMFVGFIDTDTLFVTPVTQELLFNGTKPNVIGQYGNTPDEGDTIFWPKVTEQFIGKREVFRCMSYFPVVIKVEHIVEMRNYIVGVHNKTFLQIFSDLSHNPKGYSQFNIMCNYMWYFHRAEYQFYAQQDHPFDRLKKAISAADRQPADYYTKHLTNAMKFPFPRSCIHFSYHPGIEPYIPGKSDKAMPGLIKEGQCFSGGFKWCPEQCRNINASSLHKHLFLFERSNWTWHEHCVDSQRMHYLNIEKNYNEEVKKKVLHWCEQQNKS